MKNLKFRLITYSLLAMGMLLFFVVSCNKDERPANDPPATTLDEKALQLESDPDFEKFSALNEEYLNEVSAILADKGLSEDDLRQMIDNNEEAKLDAVFENSDLERIMGQLGPVNERLATNYGELLSEIDQNPEVESRASSCWTRYISCISNAYSSYRTCMANGRYGGSGSAWHRKCSSGYWNIMRFCSEDYRNCTYNN